MVLWDTVLITAKTFGRGIIDYNRGCRNAFCLLSSHIDGLEVAEVRRDVYTMPFPVCRKHFSNISNELLDV